MKSMKNTLYSICKTFIILIFIVVLTSLVGYCSNAKYNITADKLDLESVDSYPQKIVKIFSEKTPYKLTILTHQGEDRSKSIPMEKYDYATEISQYLQPTAKIESDSPVIINLAKTIAQNKNDIVQIAQEVATWVSQNIQYDQVLAQKIWNGTIDSQSAEETIKQNKGTCSEYTNVFIAIMRSKGIPARFVTGFIYGGMYHAWAEIYLKDIGWIPVDPQMGKVGVTDRHIKLFVGKDFVDLNIKLKDIKIKVFKSN